LSYCIKDEKSTMEKARGMIR